ncbi:folylpolyglutamate synthase [Rhodotorula kratochvilovae]
MTAPHDAPPPVPADLPAAMPGISLGLARINRLLTLLRSPHLATPVVHISGTNGKGSVSAYLSSILSHSQLGVGRFNSPHLVDEWDCIHLHGRAVDARQFYDAKREVEQVSQQEGVGATSFEVLTATAFALFARATPPLDVAVVEVGMGGAEDATNVVPAAQTLLSIVTSIDLDHQKFLGDTVGEIAQVKAAIAREGGDAVLSVQAHDEAREAVLAVARARGAAVWEAGEATVLPSDEAPDASSLPPPPLVSIPLVATAIHAPSGITPSSATSLTARLPLPGSYQLSNAATAVLAAQLLRTLPRQRALVPALASQITDASIRAGVEATRWPARLSWLSLPSPPSAAPSTTSAPWRNVLLDGAHNPSSAALLASYLSSLPPSLRPTALVFALSAPRDPADVLRPLLRALAPSGADARVELVCTAFTPPAGMDWVRATAPAELARAAEALAAEEGLEAQVRVREAEDVEAALRMLEGEGREGTTVVAGSLYLAADVLRLERRLGGAGEV